MTTSADARPDDAAAPDAPVVEDPPFADPADAATADHAPTGNPDPDPTPDPAPGRPDDEPQAPPADTTGPAALPGSTDDDVAPSHSPEADVAAGTGLSEWAVRGLASLRAPSRDDEVNYKPTTWCRACVDASKERRGATCQQHARKNCERCGNYVTEAHTDLTYMGHAAVTRRLIIADPTWEWAPVARDITEPLATLIKAAIEAGQPNLAKTLLMSAPPAYVSDGLWITLTVCGVTREGFGDAQGKRGPNAIKEVIGDAIRNAAMRFGCGLDLWHKGQFADADTGSDGDAALPTPAERAREAANPDARQAVNDAAHDSATRAGGQQAQSGSNGAAGDGAPTMDVQVVLDTLRGVRGKTAWTALRKSAEQAGILDVVVQLNGETVTLAEAFDVRARQLAATQ